MEMEKGKEIRGKANNWKIVCKVATGEGGSSNKNIDEFVFFYHLVCIVQVILGDVQTDLAQSMY